MVGYPLWEVRTPPAPHLLLGAPALFQPGLMPLDVWGEVGTRPPLASHPFTLPL